MTPTSERIIAYSLQARRAFLSNNLVPHLLLESRARSKTLSIFRYARHLSVETNSLRTSPVDDNARHSNVLLTSKHDAAESAAARADTSTTFQLPVTCPGCGALSQEANAKDAGFYSRSRKAVKAYLRLESITWKGARTSTSHHEDNPAGPTSYHAGSSPGTQATPVCDRCHNLIFNNKGQSIAHPSLQALADSIAESAFDRNHVYHVLDAADFPMSLIPKVFASLQLAKPRGQNRRARFKFTRKPTMSFIITRSDLLGPSKEMVDRMMPYFQSVLRTALGRDGKDIRLGNIHLVSAKRGWWTKELKHDIWERGGGNWMVGKVNVGKSNLFPVLFPRGSGDRAPVYAEMQKAKESQGERCTTDTFDGRTYLEEESLLPPSQPEVPFPTLPIVSNLPGTTASPIRLSFGNRKGELIDLPGLDRGNLEQHVHPSHKPDLVMQRRPNIGKCIIKPGQSLLLGGGLIRITPLLDPNDPSTTMLAYPFVPLEAHVTATDKAVSTQLQERQSGIPTILAEDAGKHIKSSGKCGLLTDVTKTHAQALIRAKVPMSKLPFRVYSTDILIEGVGWIELVCQVRRKPQASLFGMSYSTMPTQTNSPDESVSEENSSAAEKSVEVEPSFKPFSEQTLIPKDGFFSPSSAEFPIPEVEIYSPNGKHVGQRPPLGASMYLQAGNEQQGKTVAVARPRRSMKGAKKRQRET